MDTTSNAQTLNTKKKDPLFAPFLIALIGTIAITIAFFLPYSSATSSYRERLEMYPDSIYIEEIDMTAGDATDISMLEYARIYLYTAESNSYGTSRTIVSIIRVVLIVVIGLSSLLSLAFTLLKKAVPLLVFCTLTPLAFHLLTWDFQSSGIVPSEHYGWGMSYYLYYIFSIVSIAGAIYLLVVKKTQNTMAQQSDT